MDDLNRLALTYVYTSIIPVVMLTSDQVRLQNLQRRSSHLVRINCQLEFLQGVRSVFDDSIQHMVTCCIRRLGTVYPASTVLGTSSRGLCLIFL